MLSGLGITTPFVLTSGGASERKNLAVLAAAWLSISRARPDLPSCCPGLSTLDGLRSSRRCRVRA